MNDLARKIFQNTFFYFFLIVSIWVFCFRDFIFDKLPFSSDAGAYYGHIKFYIESLMKGIYPFWSPEHQAPSEFFLRRFDSFNPVFFLLAILKVLGMPWDLAYRLFLALYYLLAMTGFYLIAKRVLDSQPMAFVACTLLMFSSLGTRIIDSYIIFMFTAMVWFFYFLVAFTQDRQRKYLLGITFCLMILATTYIPFYFVVIFIMFIISYLIVYYRDVKSILKRYGEFIKQNKIFTSLCVLALGLSLIVPVLFYLETGKGELVLPMRNFNMGPEGDQHVLAVNLETIAHWGIPEDLLFSSYFLFSRLPQFQSAIFYIPLFAYIALLCGLITPMNRKLLLLALWAIGLLLINLPHGTPIHAYLYEHVKIFHYFRNLHFFLWVILLPIFILFVVEQFRMFWAFDPKTKKQKIGLAVFIVAVHAGLAFFIYTMGSRNWSSYIVISTSSIFFCIRFFARRYTRSMIGILPIVFLVVVEPVEVYHYFTKSFYPTVTTSSDIAGEKKPGLAPGPVDPNEDKMARRVTYYRVNWHYLLAMNLTPAVLEKYQYTDPKFLVYDHVEIIDDQKVDFEKIGQAFWDEKNVAFVARDGKSYHAPDQPANVYPATRDALSGESVDLKIVKSDINSITLKTKFPRARFLVYNESFHSGWQAFINGAKVDLWRANVAFKGLWVPAGENVIDLKFGSPAKYIFNVFILGLFYAVFLGVIWLHVRRA